MKSSGSVEWIGNERPTKLWGTIDLIFIVSLAILVVVVTVVFLVVGTEDIVILMAGLFLPPFLGAVGLYVHFWYRVIWPPDVGLSDDGLHLRFSTGEGRFLRWADIDRVRLVGPGPPSAFGMMQSIVYRKNGKLERADIYGDAAVALKQRFDADVGGIADTRSPPEE